MALGILDLSAKDLGFDGCGIVSAVGPGVKNFSVGDRVIYMYSGCLSTYIKLPQALCVKIGNSLTNEQAAGLPCVYATVIMGMIDKANLKRGQVSTSRIFSNLAHVSSD